jgi:hypothetical protein
MSCQDHPCARGVDLGGLEALDQGAERGHSPQAGVGVGPARRLTELRDIHGRQHMLTNGSVNMC